MKKTSLFLYTLLMSTCFTETAKADSSPIELELGGYFRGYISYINQSEKSGSVNPVDLLRQTEVSFNASYDITPDVQLDVHVEGQADGADDFFLDESYVAFTSNWGKLYLGRTYGSAYILQVAAPSADSNIDGRRQMVQPVNFSVAGINLGSSTETDYDPDVSVKHDKLVYLTPNLHGLQMGLAYTPESDLNSRGNSGNASNQDDSLPTSKIWDFGLRYQNDISEDTDYRMGLGYSNAQPEIGNADNREAWNVGLDFNIHQFGIGAAYMNDDLGDRSRYISYTAIGADYKLGNTTYGISYYNKDDDVNSFEMDRYTIGAIYRVIPGLSLRSSFLYYDLTDADSSAKANAILIGTDINF